MSYHPCTVNCGATDCTAPGGYANTTSTAIKQCGHKNGWYVVVHFWIFKKTVFVCSDCGEVRKP